MPGTGLDAGHLSINTIDKNLVVCLCFRASALAGADTNSFTQMMTGGRVLRSAREEPGGQGS